MKGKRKNKMIGWIIAGVVLLGLGITGKIMWSKLQKEHEEARSLPLDKVDFSRLQDGVYEGSYEGGMYKWRANSVKVTVAAGEVSRIEPISGIEDQGKVPTRELFERVIAEQTLQVDTISGATLTSKAYLQSVENALLLAQ